VFGGFIPWFDIKVGSIDLPLHLRACLEIHGCLEVPSRSNAAWISRVVFSVFIES
jgi:hypothetical protein